MESLLKTILIECEKHELMYRANACELWNHGCTDMIEPWGYDFDALANSFKEFEHDERLGNIQILPASEVQTHAELIKSIRQNAIEDCGCQEQELNIKAMTDEAIINDYPDEYYSGRYWIMWTNYGGNEHTDCFTDYTTGLDQYFDVSKLTDEWEEQYIDFKLGLI